MRRLIAVVAVSCAGCASVPVTVEVPVVPGWCAADADPVMLAGPRPIDASWLVLPGLVTADPWVMVRLLSGQRGSLDGVQ